MLALVLWAVLSGAPDLPPLHVDVLDGRVELAAESGVLELEGPSAQRDHSGPGYLRAGASSRLSLRWRGAATLDLEGVSSVEWRPSERGHGLSITLERVERANLEVRRGPLRLELPGGWLAHIRQGAVFVRELSDGSVELEHVAGAPLLLSRSGARDEVRPPWTVLPGARLRLESEAEGPRTAPGARARVLEVWGRPPEVTRETSAPAKPRSGFAWPWNDAPTASSPPPPEPPARRNAPWGPGWGRR
jgi:hypothetical protein